MDQEKLLLQLKDLLQEEALLKKKEAIKPLINSLKKMQDEIRNTETQSIELQTTITAAEQKVLETEKLMGTLNNKIEDTKDKLYGTKGGSLKELLSFQQSVQKMEEEAAKAEGLYLELIKSIEELKHSRVKIKEIFKALKIKYNEELKIYKEESQKFEQNIAENQLRQNKIKENLKPETIKLLTETIRRFPTDPVAILRTGICSGCHISIPSVLSIHILEGKKIHRCDSCGRILIKE